MLLSDPFIVSRWVIKYSCLVATLRTVRVLNTRTQIFQQLCTQILRTCRLRCTSPTPHHQSTTFQNSLLKAFTAHAQAGFCVHSLKTQPIRRLPAICSHLFFSPYFSLSHSLFLPILFLHLSSFPHSLISVHSTSNKSKLLWDKYRLPLCCEASELERITDIDVCSIFSSCPLYFDNSLSPPSQY